MLWKKGWPAWRTLSGVKANLCDAVDRLDGLETDYGEITQATKATIREFQKGVKEDACFLTQEVRNLRTFVENELRAIREEVEEIHTEWASHRNSPSTSLGATTSTNTIQVPKPSTYSGNWKAMEVEIFLFGLEQYFEAKGVRDNATRIANAPVFLRESARVELERRNVQDIDTAIAAAESLTDYSRPKERNDNHEEERDKSKDHDRKEKGRSKSDNGDNRQD
ncbi:hypothetical protein EZV62_022433 [Acer yangbiense]|uniref:Uncharacterized protein n=1 Tax=Acer yangbiense TaxID=1000413 RepID=A0A5C7H8K8_9ROSI|nr:hypothetical protein EZV62_022433 [Acer yangbiense]